VGGACVLHTDFSFAIANLVFILLLILFVPSSRFLLLEAAGKHFIQDHHGEMFLEVEFGIIKVMRSSSSFQGVNDQSN
jgi:hypothetical protein